MADFLKMQVAAWNSGDLPINACVNTLTFRRNIIDANAGNNDQQLVDDLWAIYNNANWTFAGCDRLSVKAYDMEDTAGGVAGGNGPVAMKEGATIARATAGVREVALCLSFRGGVNTARQRGRIYLGPLGYNDTDSARPEVSLITNALNLATAFSNLGGVDIDWCVHSPTTRAGSLDLGPSTHPVKLAWVDDAWDTQRRRGLRPLARTTRAFDE